MGAVNKNRPDWAILLRLGYIAQVGLRSGSLAAASLGEEIFRNSACDEPFDPELTTEGLSRVEGARWKISVGDRGDE